VATATLEAHTGTPSQRPWRVTLQGGTALAAAMGVGRFVYTPILPLMHTQAGLSVQHGSALATANYVGYLIGALLGIAAPHAVRSPATLRISLTAITATLALMPATHIFAAWFGLRLIAGAASALVFVVAVNAVLGALRAHGQHLTGWAFGGIGTGITLSGALVLLLRGADDWRQAWWLAAALSLVLSIAAWPLPIPTDAPRAVATPESSASARLLDSRFAGLFVTYEASLADAAEDELPEHVARQQDPGRSPARRQYGPTWRDRQYLRVPAGAGSTSRCR